MTHQVPGYIEILILRVRGADASVKTPTPAELLGWGPRRWGVSPRVRVTKAIKAREAGGSRIVRTNVERDGYHPLSRVQLPLRYLTRGSRPRLYADVRSAD